MKLFKKNNQKKHEKTENVVTVRKEIDILNYSPLPYELSQESKTFLQHAKKELTSRVSAMNLDDLNEEALDMYIESEIEKMREEAREQYTYHLNAIKFDKGVVDGRLATAKGHYENLSEDLSNINKEIQIYRKLREENCLY